MDAQCRTFWRWYILATAAAAAAAAAIIPAAAVATGDACSAGPWSETACCTGNRPGAEDSLSVTECHSSPMHGMSSEALSWSHETLEEDDNPLVRIYLYSHCINPTNTSSAPSMSTLLNNADRTYLTSSTVILQPTNSVCSYFGCYEGCFELCHYTFSDVSCTAAQDMSSTVLQIQSTSIHLQSTVATTSSVVPTLVSSVTVESSSTNQQTTSSLSHESGGVDNADSPPPTWLWLIPLLIIVLLTVITAGVMVAIFCNKPRHVLSNKNGALWHTDTWTSSPAGKNNLPGRLDTLSLQSMHTLYEEVLSTPNEKVQVVPVDHMELPVSPYITTDGDLTIEASDDASPNQNNGSICKYESSTSSGMSTCDGETIEISTYYDDDISASDSNTGTLENGSSTRTNDSGNASYITYGSLNSLLTKPQWKENSST